MGEFASKGVAGAGLGTGIAGLSLGVLNAAGGLLGGIGNRWGWNNGGCGYGCGWGDGGIVGLYQSEMMAQRNAEIAFYRAKSYSDETGLEAYKYIDSRLRAIEERIHNNEVQQVAFNSTTTAALTALQGQTTTLQQLIASITRMAVPESAICNFNSCCNNGCNTVVT